MAAATYVSGRGNLPPEPTAHVLDMSIGLGAAHTFRSAARGSTESALGSLQFRGLVGRTLAVAAGVDAEGGYSGSGTEGRAALYPLGLGYHLPRNGYVALMGGIGVSGQTAVLARSWEVPLELRGAAPLGGTRASFFLRAAWLGSSSRQAPSSWAGIDAVVAGVALRVTREHPYGGSIAAGRGLYVGATGGWEHGATRATVVVGVNFTGGAR
jgi:hypothetical protein